MSMTTLTERRTSGTRTPLPGVPLPIPRRRVAISPARIPARSFVSSGPCGKGEPGPSGSASGPAARVTASSALQHGSRALELQQPPAPSPQLSQPLRSNHGFDNGLGAGHLDHHRRLGHSQFRHQPAALLPHPGTEQRRTGAADGAQTAPLGARYGLGRVHLVAHCGAVSVR